MRLCALLLLLAMPVASAAAEPDAGFEVADLAQAVASAHDLADQMAMSDPAAGARELEAVIETPFPAGEASRELRMDLFAHVAELYLASHEPAKALAAARRGLAELPRHVQDRFTALLMVREGEALEASGDEAGAKRSYERAIDFARRLMGPPA